MIRKIVYAMGLLVALTGFSALLLKMTTRPSPPAPTNQPLPQNQTNSIPAQVVAELQEIQAALGNEEMDFSRVREILTRIAQKNHAMQDILLNGLLEQSREMDEEAEAVRAKLRESDDEQARLLAEVLDTLRDDRKSQEAGWQAVYQAIDTVKDEMTQTAALQDPNQVLAEALQSLTSGGNNQAFTRSYRWTMTIPIVPEEHGQPTDGLGEYDFERSQWKKVPLAEEDPYGIREIEDMPQYFAERWGYWNNKPCPFTHLRIVGDVIMTLDLSVLNFRIHQNPTNERVVIITLPRPKITAVRFLWEPNTNGMCLIEREKPYRLVPFSPPLSSRDQWERCFTMAFLYDCLSNQVVDPEAALRGVANLLTPIFERKGFAVTYSIEEISNSDIATAFRQANGL
mgnify:CR=1 FL=1